MFGSIELFLNLAWAAIGLASFVWLGAQIAAAPTRRRRAHLIGAGSLALLCVVVLLFPIISVTDDLHSGNVSAEDETTIAKRGDAGHTSVVILAGAIAIPQRSGVSVNVEHPRLAVASTLLDLRTNPRSPPFATA